MLTDHINICRSEADQLSNELIHYIGKEKKAFKIQLLTDLKKHKHVQARENFLTNSMKRLADDQLNAELDDGKN